MSKQKQRVFLDAYEFVPAVWDKASISAQDASATARIRRMAPGFLLSGIEYIGIVEPRGYLILIDPGDAIGV